MYTYFDIQDGALETAFDHAKRALDIARLAGATTPRVAAALYYLGDICLRQGKKQESM
jgi:hypothetical protein